ncbi:sigma-70 family RNA polymerase sigma factor [Paenibacillus sp.]|jgi:RNA polymerase sigma-70 factor (ECF subfamily)|uniref:sigma-70 family RNA polymerase sigma factor n=1 Tax=Paenibacillus sp. TaxID=58172 RepID=UPI00282EEEFC|nr:sigma-70 family RNA polymerase sigma factor [Paenibacillus sp.]MDR0267312.1 sigma-70 family RNA polymerase sigma factor [Paenibacillus sp.]
MLIVIDETDIRKAQQGDREAFIRLFRQLEPEMYGLSKSILKQDADCADAMQEATLKAFKSIAGLKQPQYFKTWVLRIVINECNQILRNQKRVVMMADVPEPEPEKLSCSDSGDIGSDIREKVSRLDDKLRIVTELFYFHDQSVKQIAQVLDISETAVRTRLHRARSRLMKSYAKSQKGDLNYGSI